MTQDDECRARDDASRSPLLDRQFELDHPPERVWAAVTRPDLLARWLLPCDVGGRDGGRLEPGARFSLAMPPDEGGEGRIDCEVVEAQPGRRIAFTWRTHRDREACSEEALDALVTFELDPLPRGRTRLRIRQAELAASARGATVRRLAEARVRRAQHPPRSRRTPALAIRVARLAA